MTTVGVRRRTAIGVTAIALLLTGALVAVALSSAARRPSAAQVVAEESAANRTIARHDAQRRLALFSALPGAVPHPHQPAGIGKKLSGEGPVPGDSRQVHFFRFFTVPGSPREVHTWLRRHPPRGSAAWESGGGFIYWEHGPPGTRGATAVVRAVPRKNGGSAVRIDIYESWELPRSPAARIPPGTRYLALTIYPSSEGFVGEAPQPTRHAHTTNPRLIAGLARIVDHASAFQLYRPPTCGPMPEPGQTHSYVFYFKAAPHGRTLSRVSQTAPIGLCDSLVLALGEGRHPFALEGGGSLLHRAHGLIRQALPRPH